MQYVSEKLPSHSGLIILPETALFPGSLLPLYIFEPRYRKMLEAALAGERMFAVAHCGDGGEVAPVAGLGIVRACVANADGTSNLILQGVSRVLLSEVKMEPFPQATISALEDVGADSELAQGLRGDVVEAFSRLKKCGIEIPRGFEGYLAQLTGAGSYADAITSAFVTDPVERRGLLEETNVPARLSRLLRCLMRQLQGLA